VRFWDGAARTKQAAQSARGMSDNHCKTAQIVEVRVAKRCAWGIVQGVGAAALRPPVFSHDIQVTNSLTRMHCVHPRGDGSLIAK